MWQWIFLFSDESVILYPSLNINIVIELRRWDGWGKYHKMRNAYKILSDETT
jgi:hypothetical protein